MKYRTINIFKLINILLIICLIIIVGLKNISLASENIENDNQKIEKNTSILNSTPKVVVKIGENENSFDDLKTAIASASISEQTVIILNDNIEITEEMKIVANTNIVIDGQSKYFISRGTLSNGTKYTKTFFNVAKDAKFALNNVTIDCGNQYIFDKIGYNSAVESGEKETDVFKYIHPEETGILTTDWVIKVAGEANIYNSTFKNLCSKNSAGIFSCSAGAKLNFDNSIITHAASNSGGIAINITGADAKAEINGNSKIYDIFVGGNGGIFKIYYGAKVEMNDGEVSEVSSINCNGIVSMTYGVGSTFVLNGGLLRNNSGIVGNNNGRNGMIYIHSGSKYIMNGGTIEENRGQGFGGIDAAGHSNSSLELNAGTIKNNINNGKRISRTDVSIAADYDIVIGEGMYIEGYIYVAGDVTNNGKVKGWIVSDLTTNSNEIAYKGTGTVDGDVIVYHKEGEEPKVENRENILGDPVFCGPTETLAAVLFVNGQVNEKGRYYELHDVQKNEILNIDDPVKKGHSTSDYYTDEDLENVLNQVITDKTIVYAEFIPNKYKTTWEVDGEQIEVDVVYGEKVKVIEEPKKEGYTFVGWSGYTEGMTQDDSDAVYKAIWKANEHKVKFMINSTVVYTEVIAEYDSKVNKPTDPIHEGLIFDGWYADSAYKQPYDFNSLVKSDIVIYAKWKAPGGAPEPQNTELQNKETPSKDIQNTISNPKTSDNINVYFITLAISIVFVGVIVILKKKVKNNSK